jgi:hypothetical protein
MNCKEFPPYVPLSDYNVFHILGISAKEVIMCRFLADLLNPEGQHGCGISFLKSFMHDVLNEYSMSDIQLARTEVAAEYVIDNERRIDIVIQNPRFFCPYRSQNLCRRTGGAMLRLLSICEKFSACLSDKVWECPLRIQSEREIRNGHSAH